MKKYLKNISEQGSMMVEALAMLGLITMVTPILYKKAAERTTELQDINTATQLRTMSKALDDYIKDNYTILDEDIEENQAANIDPEDIKDYLPYNFETKSKLFNDFSFSVRKSIIAAADPDDEGTASFTGVVLAPLADEEDLPRIRASKIASMVGANGGIVEGTDIKGVQGTWNAPAADFIFKNADGENIDVKPNSLAISSVHAVTSSSGIASEAALSEDVLHRIPQDDPLLNTMETALLMGGNDIRDVVKIIAKGEEGITLDGKVVANGDISGQNITASGELKGASASISGLLKAGSAEIDNTLQVELLSTLKGGVKTDTITANTEGSSITLASNVEANEKVTVKKLLTGEGGIVAKGSIEGNSDYALIVKDNNLLVEKNAQINGDVTVNQNLIAKKLYGDEELGGGFISDVVGYNFVAGDSNVSINKPSFNVGETLTITDTETAISSPTVNISSIYGDYTAQLEMMVDAEESNANLSADNIIISSGVGTLHMVEDQTELRTNKFRIWNNQEGGLEFDVATGNGGLNISPSSFSMAIATSEEDGVDSIISGYENSIDLSSKNVTLNASSGGKVTIDAPELVYQSGGEVYQYFHMNPDEMIFDNTTPSPTLEAKDVRASGVRINRAGIIDLPMAPHEDKTAMNKATGALSIPGYIRADRLVSNVAYPETGGYWGVGEGDYNAAVAASTDDGGSGKTNRYDAYQVNPAYTSVMHDIKLTTRGGARLSDILPDFINKGIYVLDNTYKEDSNTRNWESYTVNPRPDSEALKEYGSDAMVTDGRPDNCDDANCIASPWLGFVPTPQCPPGYSKVITISPIRWKMSEAYYVAGTEAISAENLKTDSANFRKYFYPPTNPLTNQMKIEVTEDSENKHTARVLGYEDNDSTLDYALPLTFQTNTWLNTTISGVYSEGGSSNTAAGSGDTGGQRMSTFVGWHAIMGFLYPASDYADYLKKLTEKTYDSGTIIWNLFPVYNEEMTAIANVYCYFERRKMTDTPEWEWDSRYVDGGDPNDNDPRKRGYDQLTNFRFGFEKNNDAYNERLNDPALGYDEVW